MKNLKIILLLLATFGSTPLFAKLQGQARIDSLLKELPRQKEDTNKAKLLNDLAWAYGGINPDEGIKYGQQQLELATKLNWKRGIFLAYTNRGIYYSNKSDYPKALEYFFKSLKLAEEMGDKEAIAGGTGNIGNIYDSQSDYPRALEYYFKALKMFEEMGNKRGAASFANNIAVVYRTQSNYPKALEYCFIALKLFEELGNNSGIAASTGNIGNVFYKQKNYPKALEYYLKAIKVWEEMGNKSGTAGENTSIGRVYGAQGDFLKALEYYFKALKFYEEIGNKHSIGSTTSNISLVYKSQKNYTMAIDYCYRSLQLAEEIGDKHLAAGNMCNIGLVYIAIVESAAGNTSKVNGDMELSVNKYKPTISIPKDKAALLAAAIDRIQRALAICKEINDLDFRQECYEGLSVAYKLNGNYKQAMEYGDSLKIIKDSVFSQENREKIANMEDARKQYGDSLKAVAEKKTTDIKAAHRRNYELIGGGVIVLLLGFAFFITRNRNLLSKEKQQSETLLHNILPEEVAAQLKDTGKSAARQFDNVSVMFTDFVNFTEASERMKPEALIEELDTCFKAFDEITTKYNIEKIKTIGDAYLAVCGLPTADPLHAENVIKAAIEIVGFMENRLAKMGSDRTFAVRIGIHSGSVVAGIVGVKKFAYDIWGDTVNTAARMEQNSEAGKINISQTTYELVKDIFSCEYRGEVEAKGKGVMKMYFVG